MTRIPESTRTESHHVVRFSRLKPPADKPLALATIDQLNGDVARVEADLDHADPQTFQSDDEYVAWRRRATSALGYMRAELTFLEQWLEERSRPLHQTSRHRSGGRSGNVYDDIGAIAQRIRVRARDLAQEIDHDYIPRYSSNRLPKTLSAAHDQMNQLSQIKVRLQGAFSEITAEWTDHPLRRNDLSGVKTPLQRILSQVEVEVSVLKGYIRTQAQAESMDRTNHKKVCAGALTRALTNGFVLTPEEQVAFAWLQS